MERIELPTDPGLSEPGCLYVRKLKGRKLDFAIAGPDFGAACHMVVGPNARPSPGWVYEWHGPAPVTILTGREREPRQDRE